MGALYGARPGDERLKLPTFGRVIQFSTGQSVLWQTINTVPGKKYTLRGYWRIGPGGNGGVCQRCNPLYPWIGAFFVDG